MTMWTRLTNHRSVPLTCALLSLFLVIGSVCAAQDQPGKKIEIKTKNTKAERAGKVDFAEALGLNLASVSNLGARIDAAREAMDPVALASAARDLAAAEKVADKQASITAAELAKESVDLAKLRSQPQELRVVALLSGDNSVQSELEKLATDVEKRLQAAKDGDKARGIQGTLFVENYTKWYITIYVDGINVGVMRPFGTGSVFVGDPAFYMTTLYGRAPGTTITWGPVGVSDPKGNYLWKLY